MERHSRRLAARTLTDPICRKLPLSGAHYSQENNHGYTIRKRIGPGRRHLTRRPRPRPGPRSRAQPRCSRQLKSRPQALLRGMATGNQGLGRKETIHRGRPMAGRGRRHCLLRRHARSGRLRRHTRLPGLRCPGASSSAPFRRKRAASLPMLPRLPSTPTTPTPNISNRH